MVLQPLEYFGEQIRKVLVMVNSKLYTDREAEAVVKDEKEKIQAEVRCTQKQRMAVEDELVRTDQAITKRKKNWSN